MKGSRLFVGTTNNLKANFLLSTKRLVINMPSSALPFFFSDYSSFSLGLFDSRRKGLLFEMMSAVMSLAA